MSVEAIESADYGTQGSNYAAEEVYPHEIVTDTPGTGVELLDGDESSWDGIARAFNSAQWIHEHDEDTSNLSYDGSSGTLPENDRVPYGGYEDGAVIRPLTISDSGNGESAPDISEGDVVGVADTTVGDGETDWAGRVVQEGYSNGATTFNRSNDNFVVIGEAPPQGVGQLSVTSFDEQIRVRVDKSL